MPLIPPIKDGDWRSVRDAINKLASIKLGTDASPTFAGLTVNGAIGCTTITATGRGTFGSVKVDNVTWDADLFLSSGALALQADGGNLTLDATNGLVTIDATGAISITSSNGTVSLIGEDTTQVLSNSGNVVVTSNTGSVNLTAAAAVNIVANSGDITLEPTGNVKVLADILFNDDASTIGSDTINNLLTLNATGLLVNGTIGAGAITSTGLGTFEQLLIDGTNPEALLVRKNADGGDVFTVNTTNGTFGFNAAGSSVVGLNHTFTRTLTDDWTAGAYAQTMTGSTNNIDLAALRFNNFSALSGTGLTLTGFQVDNQVQSPGSGTTDNVYGLKLDGGIETAVFDSAVISDWRQIHISDVSKTTGFGTFTTLYGLYIEDIGGGTNPATNNWAIYSLGGQSSHAGNFKIGDNVAPTLATFEVEGTTRLGDVSDNYTAFSATGDTFWVGAGAGLVYGNMDQDGGTFDVTLTDINTLYELDAATTHISAGPLNDVTFPGDHYLEVKTAGVYFITYSLIAAIDGLTGGSEHIEFEILKNGSAMSKGETHIDFKNTVREFPAGSNTLIALAVDDEVSIGATAVDSSGKTITMDHLEMSIVMVGGV